MTNRTNLTNLIEALKSHGIWTELQRAAAQLVANKASDRRLLAYYSRHRRHGALKSRRKAHTELLQLVRRQAADDGIDLTPLYRELLAVPVGRLYDGGSLAML